MYFPVSALLVLRLQGLAMLLYRGFGDHACMVNALLTEQSLQTPLPWELGTRFYVIQAGLKLTI